LQINGRNRGGRSRLESLVESTPFNFTIAILILISVGLIIWELLLPAGTTRSQVIQINDLITWIFVVELSLRYIVAPNKRIFFQNYWIDILAVIPVLRPFRTLRVLRLLRILRLARASAILLKEAGWVSRRIDRYFGSFGFLALTAILLVVCATIAIISLENPNPEAGIPLIDLTQGLWSTIFLFISGEVTGEAPITTAGKLVSILITIAGLVLFAVMVGTVSASMSAFFKTRMDAKELTLNDLSDHVIICGYSRKVDLILEELEASQTIWRRGVVVVARSEGDVFEKANIKNRKRLFHLNEDFTKFDILEEARASTARTAIVLADYSSRLSDQDRDARTVLAALTLEKLNPEIFTCAELLNEKNSTHLKLAGVEEVISGNHLSAGIFASSAINKGLSCFISDIFSHQNGNYVRKIELPKDLTGKSFVEVAKNLKTQYDCLLVAIEENGEGMNINPPSEHLLSENCELTVIVKKDSEICNL